MRYLKLRTQFLGPLCLWQCFKCLLKSPSWENGSHIGCICLTFLHCDFSNVTSNRLHENTFENAQWRKLKQVQPMWLCICSCQLFENTFENAQWRKVKQMQPVWFWVLTGVQFDETFKNAQWGNLEQMQPVWLYILSCTFETHGREKSN